MAIERDEQRHVEFANDCYRAVFDRERQCLAGLYGSDGQLNWLAEGESYRFGIPFVNGTQEGETFVSLVPRASVDNTVGTVSRSGATRVDYAFRSNHIVIDARLPLGCGPRAGLELDLHLLDLPTGACSGWKCIRLPYAARSYA